MSVWKRAFAATISAALLALTPALSTAATVTSGSYMNAVGYNEATIYGPGWGSISGASLADGKVISAFFEQMDNWTYSPYFSSWITISIKGFSSDPGKSYLSQVWSTCVPQTLEGTWANEYWYTPTLGAATWQFYGVGMLRVTPEFLLGYSPCDVYVN